MRLDTMRPSAMEILEELRQATTADELWAVEVSANALATIHAAMLDLVHALQNFQNCGDMTLEHRQNLAVTAIYRAIGPKQTTIEPTPTDEISELLARAWQFDSKPHLLFSHIAQMAKRRPDQFTNEVVRLMDEAYNNINAWKRARHAR